MYHTWRFTWRSPCRTARKNGPSGLFISSRRWLLKNLKIWTGHLCVFVAYAFGEKGHLWPFSSPLRVLVPRSFSQTSISRPSGIGSVCKETSPQHNLRLSSRALNPKCRKIIHHMVLWRATGSFLCAECATLKKLFFFFFFFSQRASRVGTVAFAYRTRFLRLASITFRENANSSSFRMFILDPESDRNLWILLCSPVKELGSYFSPLIFLTSLNNFPSRWSRSSDGKSKIWTFVFFISPRKR